MPSVLNSRRIHGAGTTQLRRLASCWPAWRAPLPRSGVRCARGHAAAAAAMRGRSVRVQRRAVEIALLCAQRLIVWPCCAVVLRVV
eukprot:SAG25_NODE_660_length_6096_cov_2.291764_7_plen_86_part_00